VARRQTRTPARRASAAQHDEELRVVAQARDRIAFALTAAVIAVYFGFIAAVAFARPFLAHLVVPGLTVGILLGAVVIVASWLLTWVYVRWTRLHYDPVLRELRR
jgi:uncharacterized membrane protein (DUF485 family)